MNVTPPASGPSASTLSGSTGSISWSAACSGETADRGETASGAAGIPTGDAADLSVLLVEDNRISQLYLRRYLERRGVKVHAASNGKEALAVLALEEVDCVFMDIQMPVMDGEEAVRRLRAGEDGVLRPDVPVVALTAHDQDGDRERFARLGMNGFLSKPVDGMDVHAMLVRFARRRE